MAAAVRHVPANSTEIAVAGGAVVYLYTTKTGLPAVLAYTPKLKKPAMNYCFMKEEQRQQTVADFISRQERHAAEQALFKQQQAMPHDLKAGDILSCSWGHEQTNVDFYEVLETTAKGATIQKIGNEMTFCDHGAMQGTVMPDRSRKIGEPRKVRVSMGGGYASVKLTSYSSAYKWDGKAERTSWYG